MNGWVEMVLRVDIRLTDAVVDVLERHSYQGVAIEHDGIPPDKLDEDELPPPTHHIIRLYLPDDEKAEQHKATINAALGGLAVEAPFYRVISEQDWSEAWKAHYHPLRIGERLVIRPVWENITLHPDDIEIVLDPGMAFGTGTHTTTQLCLEAIEMQLKPGESVLDLGSGSGILSIAAALLGAGHVHAIDIDPVATAAAAENFERNLIREPITLVTGGLPEALALGRTFDFVIVNILARVIIDMSQNGLARLFHPGSRGIFTGLIDSQADEVAAALQACGLRTGKRWQSGDWVMIEAVMPA